MADNRDAATGRRPVVLYRTHPARAHDRESRHAVAERLAAAIGAEFAGDYDVSARYGARPYYVPDDALDGASAVRLGIASSGDLFGGVVPHAFVATKAITHGLVGGDARAPEGWSTAFASRVEGAVLRGYTAFTRDDALRAVRDLLASGPVRLKRCDGVGGGGQQVVGSVDAAKTWIGAMGDDVLAATGLVIEENLAGVTTHSVGQVIVDGLAFSYCGTQRTVGNGSGREVYGGSTLECVRGGFDALEAIDMPEDARRAVALARRYDEAAFAAYPGLLASRRNYDVARGTNAAGAIGAGVLEQSWRVGGASGAEVRALEAFRADADLRHVRASTIETYDAAPEVPDGAFVYFRGIDGEGSPLVNYATLERHADAR